MPKNSSDHISAKIVYAGPVPAPVAVGQQVANLNVYRGDSLVLEAPLYAAESVERGNLQAAGIRRRRRTRHRPVPHGDEEDLDASFR